ncbi:MAG: class I SAM-dependent methyltransferase [Aridibacter sp.]
MTHIIEHAKGSVHIEDLDNHKKQITVKTANDTFVPVKTCQTDYPISLIELILNHKGIDYLCDEICRDIDPSYVQRDLEFDLMGYFTKQDFENARILDFGSGSGASSMILSRMFPSSEIVGIELDKKHVEIAEARLKHYGHKNIEFHISPSGNEIPPNIGKFDFVILSAVYEHLLPKERETVIPLIWSVIKPNGYLFMNLTPHRWFPVEHHTTGLPFLNYLPPSLALPYTRKFTNRIDKTEPWEMLLRRGIRGATENEIIKILKKSSDNEPLLLEPNQKDLKDRIDLWYSQLSKENHNLAKKTIKNVMKFLRAMTGVVLVPNLSLVIQKK